VNAPTTRFSSAALSTAGWLIVCCVIAARTATLQAAVVLQYHHVSANTPASTSVSPERFKMHLEEIAREGFQVVPLQQLVDDLRAGRPLPDRTVAITFDDGYSSVYGEAFPLLKQRAWPFTVFVNSEPHDRGQQGFMSWEQLRELHRGGATIANHTVSHAYLVRLDPAEDEVTWRARVEKEIADAEQRILQEIGEAPKLLAYPYGEYNRVVLEITGALGYAGFGQHSGPLAAYSDLRALPRFPFGGPYGERQDFLLKIRSLPMPLEGGPQSIRRETTDGHPLEDIILHGPSVRPKLILRLETGFPAGRVSCFATGQGQIPVVALESSVTTQAERPLGPGRSRYNCTAPAAETGRFYWISQPWIVL